MLHAELPHSTHCRFDCDAPRSTDCAKAPNDPRFFDCSAPDEIEFHIPRRPTMPELSSHGSRLQNSRPRSLRLFVLTSCIASSISPLVRAQAKSAAHKQVEQVVEEDAGNWRQVSKQIWDYAELGYHEDKSSALLQLQLKAAGFSLASGVADEPTAFIASYGQGKPVIA